jgi:AraC family transcriptional regulator, regulatory protein of adaptative response / methylated-DNA-[protein]-cysteine methyltransferase
MPKLSSRDFDRIARAIAYIDEHWREQPRLEAIAATLHLSPFHFERLFHNWAGITPKGYIQYITGSVAKQRLSQKSNVLDVSLAVGLSGPSRLHDLMVKLEAMTPAEAARGGAGVPIDYGIAPTPFGLMLAGCTPRGVCHLAFIEDAGQDVARAGMVACWPNARLQWNPQAIEALAARIWPAAPAPAGSPVDSPLKVWVRGTAFQFQVWRALLALGAGERTSYGALAQRLGAPRAARAVGTAVGANPVAWLIPCHRVLRAGGALGGYHWGVERKRAMLAWEALRAPAASPGSHLNA